MDAFPRSVWVVSREYAGIAEAGGVKNVACSLCEGLSAQGAEVTLLIPRYGCTDFSAVRDIRPNCVPPQRISVGGGRYVVSFDSGLANGGVRVVFVSHQVFSDKNGVYTYTPRDEEDDPTRRRGTGFLDEPVLDVLFQKSVVAYSAASGLSPDIVHCQDAATALVPALFRFSSPDVYERTGFVVTIHNAGPGYHHGIRPLEQAEFLTSLPGHFLEGCLNGDSVEPFLAAGMSSAVTTVSPWYARELSDPANGADTAGLSPLLVEKGIAVTGITNGIDCGKYDPTDTGRSRLPCAFDPRSGDLAGKYEARGLFLREYAGKPAVFASDGMTRHGFLDTDGKGIVCIGYHGRIVRQKGIDVLAAAAEDLLSRRGDICFVIAGQGEADLERTLAGLAEAHGGRCVYFRGYDRTIARLATAVSDFIVLPSQFEPCGLEDFIAQLYGTIPVAHATGGLNKIVDNKTGFLYRNNSPRDLADVLGRLVDRMLSSPDEFKAIIRRAATYVAERYSWESVIRNEYLPFYRRLRPRPGGG